MLKVKIIKDGLKMFSSREPFKPLRIEKEMDRILAAVNSNMVQPSKPWQELENLNARATSKPGRNDDVADAMGAGAMSSVARGLRGLGDSMSLSGLPLPLTAREKLAAGETFKLNNLLEYGMIPPKLPLPTDLKEPRELSEEEFNKKKFDKAAEQVRIMQEFKKQKQIEKKNEPIKLTGRRLVTLKI